MHPMTRHAAALCVAVLGLGVPYAAHAATLPNDESPIRVIGGCFMHPFRCARNLITAPFGEGSSAANSMPLSYSQPTPSGVASDCMRYPVRCAGPGELAGVRAPPPLSAAPTSTPLAPPPPAAQPTVPSAEGARDPQD